MKRFRFWISARRKGAIGIWSRFFVDVEAEDRQAAELKLYDEYEHVHVISCAEVSQ